MRGAETEEVRERHATSPHRTPYNITVSRAYNAGKNELPHHVDAMGNWVVLFSFGRSARRLRGRTRTCVNPPLRPP